MHTFYFDTVPAEFHDDGDFVAENGTHYYYKLDYDGEGFTITDTCNRYMPFDKESLKSLGLVLFGVKGFIEAEKSSKDLYTKKVNETLALLEHFNTNERY